MSDTLDLSERTPLPLAAYSSGGGRLELACEGFRWRAMDGPNTTERRVYQLSDGVTTSARTSPSVAATLAILSSNKDSITRVLERQDVDKALPPMKKPRLRYSGTLRGAAATGLFLATIGFITAFIDPGKISSGIFLSGLLILLIVGWRARRQSRIA